MATYILLYTHICDKGNCKYGQKCLLTHVLPNGQIVPKQHGGRGHLNLGGRIDPMAYHNQESALGTLMTQQVGGLPQPFNHQVPLMPEMEPPIPPMTSSQPFDVPRSNSQYGRHREDNQPPMSPRNNLTTLDVPLPASFDSNAQSFMARPGEHAASFPSGFLYDSSPLSLPKNAPPSDMLRNPQGSMISRSVMARYYGSSPSGPSLEAFQRRPMHSQQASKPNRPSSSLSQTELGDETSFGGAEDYVPGNLSHLLSDQERTRRLSGKVEDTSSVRDSLSGTPVDVPINPNKVGSPMTNSPWGNSSLSRQQQHRQEEQNGFLSSSFGHVGSPLRNSSLHLGTSPSMRSASRTSANESGPLLSTSGSQQRTPSMSVLSQQLRQSHLSGRGKTAESGNELLPSSARHASNPRNGFDRAVSSSSVGVSRIEEEQPDIFTLEEDLLPSKSSKPSNSPWSSSRNAFGSIGSRRQVTSPNNGSEGREAVNGIKIPKARQRSTDDAA